MKKDATALKFAPSAQVLEAPTLELRIGVPRYPAWERSAKRALDIFFSLIVMILGAPVFLLLALLVKVTSPGPVFFRQVRLGKNAQPFTFYKFRTMQHKNDDSVHRSFCENFIQGGESAEGRNVFKMVKDPRITRIGRFLRRSSLDELPQFYNVLRGDMSLVGPRPPISYEIEHYQDWHKDRLRVRPGLTGLWQVSGRSQVPFDEMVRLDLHYITRWSFGLDLRIIWRTLPVMIKGDGAY
jgi:exopolysaccharide biosynthesis polyprenyl glycosylphosphotransferase